MAIMSQVWGQGHTVTLLRGTDKVTQLEAEELGSKLRTLQSWGSHYSRVVTMSPCSLRAYTGWFPGM